MHTDKDALDNLVKNALQDMDVPFDPSTWARLEARLDAPAPNSTETTDVPDPVDTAVRHALGKLEVPYQAAHWTALEAKMTITHRLIQTIRTSKISEAAILMLLLLNWHQLLVVQPVPAAPAPAFEPSKPIAAVESTPKTHGVTANLPNVLVDKPNDVTTSKADHSILSFSQNSTNTEENNASYIPNNVLDATSISRTNQAAPNSAGYSVENTDGTPILTNKDGIATNNPLHTTRENSINPVADVVETRVSSEIENIELPELISEENTAMAIAPLDLLVSPITSLVEPKPIDDPSASAVVASVPKAKKTRYIATFAALENNRIHTPANLFAPVRGAYTQTRRGVGAGVLYGVKIRKWSVETGFAYSSINYAPKVDLKNLKPDPKAQLVLTGVNLEAVSIPVRVGRVLGKSKKTTVTAFAGASLTVLAESNYSYKTYRLNSSPNEPTPSPTQDKQIGKGLLEGGDFKSNSFLNLETGLRFDRSISSNNRWKLFLEPNFRHDLLKPDGIGPNGDKLSAFSIRGGVITAM